MNENNNDPIRKNRRSVMNGGEWDEGTSGECKWIEERRYGLDDDR